MKGYANLVIIVTRYTIQYTDCRLEMIGYVSTQL